MSGESDEKHPDHFDRQAIKRERAAWPAAACLIVDPPHQLDQNAGPIPRTRWSSKLPLSFAPSSCQHQAGIPVTTTGSVDRVFYDQHFKASYGLLSVGLGNLTDKLGPAHIHSCVDLAGLRSSIVFQDFHHQGCVVRDNDACL